MLHWEGNLNVLNFPLGKWGEISWLHVIIIYDQQSMLMATFLVYVLVICMCNTIKIGSLAGYM